VPGGERGTGGREPVVFGGGRLASWRPRHEGSGGWWRRRAAGGPSPVGRDAHAGAPGFASWRKRTVERGYWIGQLTGTSQSNYQPTGALLWPEPGISSWPVRQGSFKSEGRSPRILGRGRLRVRGGHAANTGRWEIRQLAGAQAARGVLWVVPAEPPGFASWWVGGCASWRGPGPPRDQAEVLNKAK
jgi:hypothetical protein